MAPGDWSVFAWHAANLPTMPEAEDIGNEAAGGRFGVSIRSAGYLRKWFLLGITIGVIAGLGAVVFYLALKYTSEFLLGYLADYQIPTPVGEGGHRGSTGFARPWAIPLVTTGGAVLSALIVAKLAPEATGHGTDEAIESVHGDPRAIRGRAVLVKMVASALTIGSGGSGGREGPTAQISAGFCSLLTRRLNLSNEDGRTAVALGLIAAAVGYLYARVFHASVAITRRLPGGPVLKPAIGGLLVGLLGLPIPQILSSGYGWAQLAADRGTLLSIPLWIVIVLPIAKILATSLSIGTGGSGGLFGPGIVIGAFVGAAIWRLGELTELPGVPHEPGIFVVVAMMACFGSVSRAPLAVMIMVAEMTGSFSVVPGAIIAVGIAALLLSRTNVTIYETQRLNRQTAEAERGGSDRPTTA